MTTDDILVILCGYIMKRLNDYKFLFLFYAVISWNYRMTIDVYSCFVWLYQENIEWQQMIFLCFVWLYHENIEWLQMIFLCFVWLYQENIKWLRMIFLCFVWLYNEIIE